MAVIDDDGNIVNDLIARAKQLTTIQPSSKKVSRRNEIIYQLYVDIERTLITITQGDGKLSPSESSSNIEKLKELRSSLKLDYDVRSSSSSLLELLFLFPRIFIFIWTIFLGSVLILLFIPLRWIHPLLRQYARIPNNYLPMDLVVRLYCRCICTAAGISITTETNNKREEEEPTLLMYSHVSNIDAFCVGSSCPFYCKFIGKAVIFLIPIFGWAGYAIGTQPISRGNRSKAVKDLHALQQKYRVYQRSIAISPEGTRSKTGLLAAFKKGPFYLWQDCGHVSITPVIIFGAYELWPPGAFFPNSGKVHVRYCEPIIIKDQSKDKDDNDNLSILRDKASTMTRNAMLEEYTKNYPSFAGTSLWNSMSTQELLTFGLEYLILLIALVFFTRVLILLWVSGLGGYSLLAQVGIFTGSIVVVDILLYFLAIL